MTTTTTRPSINFNWLNFGLAWLMAAIGAVAMNYRDNNPEVLSGWTLYGFGLLLALAAITAVLAVMSTRSHISAWVPSGAFVFGLLTGIVGTIMFFAIDVAWKPAAFGLVTVVLAAITAACIGFTTWRR